MNPQSFVNAAYTGDIETIQKMLLLGIDPDTRTENGNVAILAAASRGHYSVIETLLRRGANPNLRSGASSALSHAVSRRSRDIFYLLLDRVEQLNPEVLSYALEVAMRDGTEDLADALLKAGANINTMINPEGVIINLVNGGHVKILTSLVASAFDLNTCNRRGETALMRLANGAGHANGDGILEALKLVVSNVADPFETDLSGFSALTRASQNGYERIIEAFVLCACSLDKPDANDLTALEVAIDAGQCKVVELLLEAGVSPDRLGKDRQTPLLRAVTGTRYQSKEVIDVLLKHGADTKLKDKDGCTALEKAIQSRQKNVAQQLQQIEPNLFGEITTVVKKPDGDVQSKIIIEAEESLESGKKVRVQPKTGVVSAQEKLRDMIGLKQVKTEVSQITNSLSIQRIRKQKGLLIPGQNLHMVFTGNPGTGKTTVAGLLSKVYKELGILDKGHIVKADRARLIGTYLSGEIYRLIQSAIGGVLFVDKAHNLAENEYNPDQSGTNAVSSLMELADGQRENLVIIIAGYTEPMQKFIRSNPGLQSRFNKFLHFDDYAPAELTEIFGYFAAQGDYKLHPATELKLHNVFADLYAKRDETCGNARLARNMFERAINAHANRMVSAGMTDEASLVTLYPEDVPNG